MTSLALRKGRDADTPYRGVSRLSRNRSGWANVTEATMSRLVTLSRLSLNDTPTPAHIAGYFTVSAGCKIARLAFGQTLARP
jgi:hypothetical protein